MQFVFTVAATSPQTQPMPPNLQHKRPSSGPPVPPPARTPKRVETWKPKATKVAGPTKAALPTKTRAAKQQLKGAQATKPAGRYAGRELAAFGYETLGPIATGAFSTILRARHVESGEEVAVKTFDSARCQGKDATDRDRELEILLLIRAKGHEHIANLRAEHSSPIGLHIVLQYCGDGSLQRHLAKLSKKQLAMVELDAVLVTAQSEPHALHTAMPQTHAHHHARRTHTITRGETRTITAHTRSWQRRPLSAFGRRGAQRYQTRQCPA